MNPESRAKVYRAIPVSRRAEALGGLISILQKPGLGIDNVFISPVKGQSCVGIAVTIPDDKKNPIEYGMYLYEHDLNFLEGLLSEAHADSNSPLARVIDIWTKASQALKEAKERQA